MAKNTSSSAFRKIDIDQYNEDNFREDEAEQSIPTGPDENDVCALLNQGRFIDALHLVLKNAPMGSSNQLVKKLILLYCIYYSSASEHSHTIPVEGYETELQDLGEHVDHHETPVKVIKITKTIAVKVPVPYPVKVVQKVPYPVHIVKPYPVPVPHIVKVPQLIQKHAHEGGAHGGLEGQQDGHQNQAYEVQEVPSLGSGNGHSFLPNQEESYGGGHGQNIESLAEEYPSEGSSGSSYDAPPHSYYGGSSSPDAESFESKSYDQAIQAYLSKHHPSGGQRFNGYH